MRAKLTSSYNKIKDCTRFQLGCSIGGRIFEGDSLQSIVDWLNDFGYRDGFIDVVDTLQRHNLIAEGLEAEQAYLETKRKGLAWATRNRSILDNLKMPYSITHWDQWEKDPRFIDYEQKFSDAYNDNEAFRDGVTTDMRAHYMRVANINLEEVPKHQLEASRRFYCAEYAGLSIQFEDYGRCAEVYPGRELEGSKVIRRGGVSNAPSGLTNAVYARLFIEQNSPTPKPSRIPDQPLQP